jgi:hypothetical protein
MNSRGLAESPRAAVWIAPPAALVFASGKAREPRASRRAAAANVRQRGHGPAIDPQVRFFVATEEKPNVNSPGNTQQSDGQALL